MCRVCLLLQLSSFCLGHKFSWRTRSSTNFNEGSYYRPQRSCGQCYVFTGVCDSVHRGGFSGEAPPGTKETPPDQGEPPRDQADPPWTKENPPRDQAHPPGKNTAAYGQWAAGTHPTGMHSCLFSVFIDLHSANKRRFCPVYLLEWREWIIYRKFGSMVHTSGTSE